MAKGYTQTYGINYLETLAPIANLNSTRVLLSIPDNFAWSLQQLDVKNTFLNGQLEEEVYMDPSSSFEEKFGIQVCKLKKCLYGLKQYLELGLNGSLSSLKNKVNHKDKLAT